MRRAVALLSLVIGCAFASRAGAVTPTTKYAAEPRSLGLVYEAVHFPSVGDSAIVNGWWFPAAAPAPVLVLFPRGKGNMADLLPSVREFARRGLAVLVFDPRDFGPGGPGDCDSLRAVIFASRWVDDGEGAVRWARAKAGTQPVYAWGQDLGSNLALAVSARSRGMLDGIAIEGVFRTTQDQLGWLGVSQDPEVVRRHLLLVDQRDEPFSAASRARVPMFVVLAGKDDVTPAETTENVIAGNRVGTVRWPLPAAGHDGIERTPGYFDRVADWVKMRARMVPVRPH